MTAAIIVAQIGIVYARIALRPAGSCCTPNSTSPFQAAMLKNASTPTCHHSARGTRMESPDSDATSSMPMAASGSVSPRNVSGASSVTPIFSMGQLHPQTSVSTVIGRTARSIGCAGRAIDVTALDPSWAAARPLCGAPSGHDDLRRT